MNFTLAVFIIVPVWITEETVPQRFAPSASSAFYLCMKRKVNTCLLMEQWRWGYSKKIQENRNWNFQCITVKNFIPHMHYFYPYQTIFHIAPSPRAQWLPNLIIHRKKCYTTTLLKMVGMGFKCDHFESIISNEFHILHISQQSLTILTQF